MKDAEDNSTGCDVVMPDRETGAASPTHILGRDGKRRPRGGRKPGVPNKVNAEGRALIVSRGRPIKFLCDVAAGRRIKTGQEKGSRRAIYTAPSIEQRIAAARALMNKILPDISVTELTGLDGGPIEQHHVVEDDFSLAQKIAFILSSADHAMKAQAAAPAPAAARGAQPAEGGGQTPLAELRTTARPGASHVGAGFDETARRETGEIVTAVPAQQGLPAGYEIVQGGADGTRFAVVRHGSILTYASNRGAALHLALADWRSRGALPDPPGPAVIDAEPLAALDRHRAEANARAEWERRLGGASWPQRITNPRNT